MIRILVTLSFLAGTLFASAQSIKKYAIGNSGCAAYLYCDPGTFSTDYSEDSSAVYTGSCSKDSITYTLICVKLQPSAVSTDLDHSQELLISYLDYLKSQVGVVNAAGYGKGNHLRGNEKTIGVVDYWQDKDKNNWKVKGWTDGRLLGVLMVYSSTELPEGKANAFLDSFQFPAM